ncbi:hypothetical protein DGG96_13480 [Legionella qingyii]|uniref:Uncharacterized protein n=1 Tax=Legionella qingyii TaxID=2184757 RepID=A0A317U349_9GAMM|nr:hypothetical protein DGG96_13480 [Legionella qingyii]RUR25392.1 hypothetical protein ELY20_02750 [Legionella qingyii]RUR28497.1 hypothetical protein ELY16_03260 [Legionella qingyii]
MFRRHEEYLYPVNYSCNRRFKHVFSSFLQSAIY